jgi:hypothetical protein
VHVRVGGSDDKLYLDLCDDAWRVIEIDTTGWQVIDRPPYGSAVPPACSR